MAASMKRDGKVTEMAARSHAPAAGRRQCHHCSHVLGVDSDGGERFRGIDEIDGLRKGFEGEDFDAINDGAFFGVGFRDGDGLDAIVAGCQRGGERATNRADCAVERVHLETSCHRVLCRRIGPDNRRD